MNNDNNNPNDTNTTNEDNNLNPAVITPPDASSAEGAVKPAVDAAAAPSLPPAETPSPTSEPSPAAADASPSVLSITSGRAVPPKKGPGLPLIGLIVLVLGLLGGFFLNTALGHPLAKKETAVNNSQTQQAQQKKILTLPDGAVEINACAKGRGKQFALPKDIPFGPVYNVHEGKVTAIEFMPAQSDFTASTPKDFIDLKLYGVEYDHVNIGLLSKGHAGYPSPHYHVDVFTITHEESNKITCQ